MYVIGSCSKHVSGKHRSSRVKRRSEDLAANCRNTSGSETHCRRVRLPSLEERHSAGPCDVSSPLAALLDGEVRRDYVERDCVFQRENIPAGANVPAREPASLPGPLASERIERHFPACK